MGIITGGLFSKVRGKVAGVVFQNWKGINTVREKVKPGNPKTPKQIFQRARVSYVGVFCGLLKDTVIPKFWKQYENGTTAFSECSRTNINAQPVFVDEGTPFTPVPLDRVTSKGNLEAAPFDGDPTYDTASGNLNVGWYEETVGNGAASDKIYVQIVDQNNLVALANDTAIRSDLSIGINIGSGRTASDIYIFITAYRELTTGIFNSTSVVKV